MWRTLSLLCLCCAVGGRDARDADRSAELSREKTQLGEPDKDAAVAGALRKVEQPGAESLEDEVDNQENIISQVSNVTVRALTGH